MNNSGIRISKIVNMSSEEIRTKVLEISEQKQDFALHIDQLILAMIDLDEEMFEKSLNTMILRYGFEKTITSIVYPFLEKIGILWLTHNITPAQEHFITNLIRQKLIVAIDGTPLPPKTARRIVLYLPEGELHELGLLFYHYLCRFAGYRTYYLGQNVPHTDLIQVSEAHQPDLVVTSITTGMAIPVDEYLTRLSAELSHSTLLVSGYQVRNLENDSIERVRVFKSALEIKNYL